MFSKNILIIGSGSVGRRHAINLKNLGCSISCIDSDLNRAAKIIQEISGNNIYANINEALATEKFDGAVIATPSIFHKEHSLNVLENDLPILLEKPIATNIQDANSFLNLKKKTQESILLGYTWRWWPPLLEVKKLLNQNIIGKIHHVHFHMSAHLADWHPWERYQDFFMSKKELGGGALLDESHWIDLMVWLLGMPKSLIGRVDKISDLEIDSDDIVDIIFFYDNMHVTMHLDLFARPHEKSIRFVGQDGTILWNSEPNQISIGKDSGQKWILKKFDNDRNDMFISVAKEFLSLISNSKIPTCNIIDGINVMKIIEAIRLSSTDKKIIFL